MNDYEATLEKMDNGELVLELEANVIDICSEIKGSTYDRIRMCRRVILRRLQAKQ